MQAALHTTTHATPVSIAQRWAGRAISAFAILFLAFDGGLKALQLAPAVDGSVQLGYPAHLVLGLGLLELACLALYALPRTAALGALLLTGFLGGAVATHVRIGSPLFSVIFPVILGALLWGGLALRDARLRALMVPQE